MLLRGKPYVPPMCPTTKFGNNFEPNVHKFELHVIDSDFAKIHDGLASITEIYGFFYEEEGSEKFSGVIDTETLLVPLGSNIALTAHTIDRSGPDVRRRLGTLFCERITQCRGIIKGKCWALSAYAVKEVIEKVAAEIEIGESSS